MSQEESPYEVPGGGQGGSTVVWAVRRGLGAVFYEDDVEVGGTDILCVAGVAFCLWALALGALLLYGVVAIGPGATTEAVVSGARGAPDPTTFLANWAVMLANWGSLILVVGAAKAVRGGLRGEWSG